MPEDLAGAKVVPLALAPLLWRSPTCIGVLWECTDLLVVSTRSRECPWRLLGLAAPQA